MLVWPTKICSKSSLKDLKLLLAVFTFSVLSMPVFSQTSEGTTLESTANKVACYKSSIKEPLTFYGNPMDTFTLYDGTRWKVSSSGAYEYTPTRYRNVLICPSEELLVIDKRAVSVSRLNQ
jgi:hypothetical protein